MSIVRRRSYDAWSCRCCEWRAEHRFSDENGTSIETSTLNIIVNLAEYHPNPNPFFPLPIRITCEMIFITLWDITLVRNFNY